MPIDEYEPDHPPPERERDTIVVEDESLRDGFTQVPNLLLRRPDLSHGAKIAYALLLSYAWQRDRCFPGQDVLASDMGVERKAVIRYLQELKAKDVIKVKRRGMGKTNVYYLPRLLDVPFLGHQEVPPVGQPEVRSRGHKEYSMKNTQNEEDLSNFEGSDDRIETAGPSPQARRAAIVTSPTDDAQGAHSLPEQDRPIGKSTPLGEILKLRQQAASSISQGSRPPYDDTPPATPMVPGQPPARDRPDRMRGSSEERERLGAFLADFARELGDQAPLSATVTRALRVFKAANVPSGLWGDFLYQARAITQEHTGQITKPGGETAGLRRKNKMPYYFGVLEQLVGLRPPPEPRRDGQGEPPPA